VFGALAGYWWNRANRRCAKVATEPLEHLYARNLEKRGSCRLTLTANRVLFSVRPVQSEDDQIKRAFRLRRIPFRSAVIFDVAETVQGATCDCPDFVFRRDGLDPRGCLHIRAMRAVGLLDK
jgi:hypothetical protein